MAMVIVGPTRITLIVGKSKEEILVVMEVGQLLQGQVLPGQLVSRK